MINNAVFAEITVPEKSGTMILACEFEGGVIIGTDSQTTTRDYINNRTADKLIKIDDYIYCSAVGPAAGIQSIVDNALFQLHVLKINLGELSVLTVAAVFRELCYINKDSICADIVVVGFDNIFGGQVYVISSGGMIKREPVAAQGSGSPYVYGYIDAHFTVNMNKTHAEKFLSKTLALGVNRNCSSGGPIQIAVITKDEVKRFLIN